MIVDFHAHILPGLDHGCPDAETSRKQIEMAKKAGVDFIAATSHFYPHRDSVESYLRRRAEALGLLSAVATEGTPRIIPAAEVLICTGMDRMDGLSDLCFEGLQTILLEMPSTRWEAGMFDTVEKINALSGGRAVIAHVDRYDPASVSSLFEIGVTGQLNADALARHFGRKKYLRWIDNGNITALGSDLHGASGGYRKFLKAKAVLGGRFELIMQRSEELLSPKKSIMPDNEQ